MLSFFPCCAPLRTDKTHRAKNSLPSIDTALTGIGSVRAGDHFMQQQIERIAIARLGVKPRLDTYCPVAIAFLGKRPGTPHPAPLRPATRPISQTQAFYCTAYWVGQGPAVLPRAVPLRRALVKKLRAIAAPLCSVRASGKLREHCLKVYLWGNPQTPSRKP
jgi:hypothetical protein